MTLFDRFTLYLIQRVTHWPRVVEDQSGAVAVEFALVSGIFIAVILAICQISLVALAQGEMETATAVAARTILTGKAAQNNLTQSQFKSLVCQNLTGLFNCVNLMVDVQTVSTFSSSSVAAPTITFNSDGTVSNTWNYNIGAPGSVVVARVMYQWPLALGPLGALMANMSNGNHLLLSSSIFENEP